MSSNDTCQYTCAIIFEEYSENIEEPSNITYKIRLSDPKLQTSMIFDEFQSTTPDTSGTIIIQMCNILHI
jgi:hypothetical protein